MKMAVLVNKSYEIWLRNFWQVLAKTHPFRKNRVSNSLNICFWKAIRIRNSKMSWKPCTETLYLPLPLWTFWQLKWNVVVSFWGDNERSRRPKSERDSRCYKYVQSTSYIEDLGLTKLKAMKKKILSCIFFWSETFQTALADDTDLFNCEYKHDTGMYNIVSLRIVKMFSANHFELIFAVRADSWYVVRCFVSIS